VRYARSVRYHKEALIDGMFSRVDTTNFNRKLKFSASNVLFKKIGIVVDPLHFDVWTVFSSSMLFGMLDDCISFGVLLLIVETFPPLLIRLLFGPTMFEKLTGGGCIEFMVST
jgi:hypothetical protein